MPRMWIGLMILVATASVLAGCNRRGGDKELKQVRLGYFANATHAQAVLGVSSGEFQKAIDPLELKTTVFNAGPSLIEAIFAGQIDIAYIGPGPAINGYVRSRGERVRVVAGAAANGVLIVARKDAGIESLADLKGRRIATPETANTQDISARHFVLHELKQADAANVLAIPNAEQVGMMLRKQVDAAWAPEPWGSRLLVEADAKVLAHEKDLWPEKELTLALVITTPDFLEKHPEVVEKMLRVHVSWTQRLEADAQQHVGALGAALYGLTGKRLPEGVLPQAVGNVKFTNDPLEPTLRTMAQWSYDLKFLREPANLDGLVDLSILKRIQQP
jgi:NitT/TauT family transport system substrate-binding protein